MMFFLSWRSDWTRPGCAQGAGQVGHLLLLLLRTRGVNLFVSLPQPEMQQWAFAHVEDCS